MVTDRECNINVTSGSQFFDIAEAWGRYGRWTDGWTDRGVWLWLWYYSWYIASRNVCLSPSLFLSPYSNPYFSTTTHHLVSRSLSPSLSLYPSAFLYLTPVHGLCLCTFYANACLPIKPRKRRANQTGQPTVRILIKLSVTLEWRVQKAREKERGTRVYGGWHLFAALRFPHTYGRRTRGRAFHRGLSFSCKVLVC